jgi:hypothetical protein
MNTRPIPETDKFFATFADGEVLAWHAEYYARLQDLERERDEAREALKTGGMFDIIDRAAHDRAAAIRERDEVWKKYDLEAVENMLAVNKIRHERDEARGQRDRLAEALRMITKFDFSNAIMVTELEEAIDVAWGSITTDVRYEMCRDSFSIGFRMGANSFLENSKAQERDSVA